MTTYNGHPSYEHWNAHLWLSSTERWYRMARAAESADVLIAAFTAMGVTRTGDGVDLTPELIEYAWRCVQD